MVMAIMTLVQLLMMRPTLWYELITHLNSNSNPRCRVTKSLTIIIPSLVMVTQSLVIIRLDGQVDQCRDGPGRSAVNPGRIGPYVV
jgi:hypothetical protein